MTQTQAQAQKLELIKKLEAKGYKILVDEVISDKHYDSFWYDGLVLSFEYKGKEYKVYACGEIRIHTQTRGYNELVYDVKERNCGFDFKLTDDDSLKNIGCNYSDKYYYENNNWFELQEGDEQTDIFGGGTIFYGLNELLGFDLDEENKEC